MVRDLFETFSNLNNPKFLFMFKVKYVDSIMMLVRLDLNLIVSLFQHKCELWETVSTTTLACNNIFYYAQLKTKLNSSFSGWKLYIQQYAFSPLLFDMNM